MSGTAQPQPWHRMEIGEGGSGPTFVWLHGWGQTLASLERIAQLFKADGRHILFDQPGFGQTPPPPTGAGSADYADMLAAELARLGVGPCIFVGHSFGARVSVQMAARHPALVSAIVLVAGAGLRRRKTFKAKARSFVIRLVGNIARLSDDILGTALRERHRDRFGSPDYKKAGVLRPTLVSVVNENLIAEARAARCPALLVYGSDDTETPPQIGRRYEAALPIARYVELAGFGHLDILSRGAWQVEAAMRAFLNDLRKGDSL